MYKGLFIVVSLIACAPGMIHSIADAQTPTPTESLLIGPGDMLHVQVYDTPQFEQHPRVSDSGDVPLLFLGDVRVVGETPAQAADTISARLVSSALMLHPQVSVLIEQFATQDVSILGQVDKPGAYPIGTPRSIFAVLSMAGGLDATADRHVIVRRRGSLGAQVTFFVANTPNGGIANDLEIYPGDTVIVPKVGFVYVLGDVARPGGYALTSNDANITVLAALAEAGSTNRTAVLSNVRLLRKTDTGYMVASVNIGAIQVGKSPDVALQPNDILFIPFSYSKNFVLNAAALATSASSAALFIP